MDKILDWILAVPKRGWQLKFNTMSFIDELDVENINDVILSPPPENNRFPEMRRMFDWIAENPGWKFDIFATGVVLSARLKAPDRRMAVVKFEKGALEKAIALLFNSETLWKT